MGKLRLDSARHKLMFMFLRYLTVGGGAFLVDFSFFFLIIRTLHISPEIAQLVSRTLGAAFGYLGHKKFSFTHDNPDDQPKQRRAIDIIGYVSIFLIGLVLSPLILWAILHFITHSVLVAKIGTEAIMVAVNFIALKTLFLGNSKKFENLQ